MLKRLLIAVFVLGLVLALSGTAFSDSVLKNYTDGFEKNLKAPLASAEKPSALPAQPAFKKPASAIQKLPAGLSVPTPPLQYFCDLQDYTSGSAAYFWTIPDAYGDDLFNMRFTADANFDCSLKVAHYLMYWPAFVGTPDFRAYVWADDGFGFPGAKLDSVDIPWATIDAEHTAQASNLFFISADFSASNLIFSDGENYHIGWTVLQGVDPSATLAIISDAADGPFAGEERASENYAGTWGTMLNDWGDDVSFFILAERCCGEIPYSDCYTQSYMNPASYPSYTWQTPHPVYGFSDFAERFTTEGPETLMSVDVDVFQSGSPLPYIPGNDDVIVTVYSDNAGLPGAQIAQVTILGGTYPFYPASAHADFSSLNLVLEGDFHIGLSTSAAFGSGDGEKFLSDGDDGVQGRSNLFDAQDLMGGGPIWWPLADVYGADDNFGIYANLCKDEYYSCSWQDWGAAVTSVYPVPDANPIIEWGQQFKADAGSECILKDLTIYMYRHPSDSLRPNMYTYNTNINVYDSPGGSLLYQKVLTPADYAAAGYTGSNFYGFLVIDLVVPDVVVPNEFMVGVESVAPTRDEGIRITYQSAGGGYLNSTWINAPAFGGWLPATALGLAADMGMTMDAKVCCIPFSEATCTPGSDAGWATMQGNQARTGASNLALGDAWCNLNLNWAYVDATQLVAFCGPVIYGDKAVCAFSNKYIVFDLATGTPVYTLTGALGSGTLIGTSVRNTPTIANIDIVGTPTDVMFFTGGSTQSVGAVNFNTGALIWERSVVTFGASALTGQTRWATLTLLNVGGMNVLFYSTDNGKVVAVDATNGAKFNQTNYPGLGWPDANNPQTLTGATYISGATDGNRLFYSTASAATEGDVYGIDAATGAIDWTLSGAGGLQAQNIYVSYNYPEGFRGGVAYDGGKLYCASYANDLGVSDHPTDGVYYVIDAGTGTLPIPAVASNRVQYSTPIVDVARVFLPSLTQWATPTAGGNLVAYNKTTSTVAWLATSPGGGRYYMSGFRTCEPGGVDDLLFVFNEDGFLECWNSVTGSEIFRRRVDHIGGLNIGMNGAIAQATGGAIHVMFADYYGGLYDFTQGADRARLQIETYHPTGPVEFGSNPALPVDFGPIITNTGCTDLIFANVYVDENVIIGTDLPDFSAGVIPKNLEEQASKIANDLARDAFLSKFQQPRQSIDESMTSVRDINLGKETKRTAAGVPAWLVSLDHPTAGDIVPAGGTINLQFTVNQTLINRGPQSCYIAFDANDPDFFLNNTPEYADALLPEIFLTVVGGCLIDTTELDFGIGQANMQWVTNTGRLGTGDWDPHAFDIDGDASSFYQGTYVYGVSHFRIAMNTQDWSSGGGETDAWVSMQPDPNFCDDQCKPPLTADVPVGAITRDGGATYDPLLADVVCKTYLDSVQNFGDGAGGWDWSAFGAAFDDTLSMGLRVDSKTYGIKDAPEFANMTFEVMTVTERNGLPVDNWYFGTMIDYDVGTDTAALDASISTAWSYTAGGNGDAAWGLIKVPFGGCDGEGPMINVKALNADSAQFRNDDAATNYNKYWDKAYEYMSMGPGAYSHANVRNGSDQEFHATIAGHDFAGGDSYKFGVAQFGFAGGVVSPALSSNYAALANTVNKWAGFGRGDVNDDGAVNIADIIYLAGYVNNGGPGPIPFVHTGDVNNDGLVNAGDITYMISFYFDCGPCPVGAWTL